MSTKKTATKKVARKRTAKKVTDTTVGETSSESVQPVNEVNTEASKKRAPRKSAKKVEEVEEAKSDSPVVEATSPAENSDRKEPIQGVRDARTQQPNTDSSNEAAQTDSSKQQEDSDTDGDQNQQGKGRNRRGRRNRNKGDQPQPQQQQVQAAPIDAKELSKKAWKVFLSEVSEEGLALIGDKEGRELAKRSFKIAELFLEEQGRRSTPKASQQQRRRPQHENRPVEGKSTESEETKAPEAPAVTEQSED